MKNATKEDDELLRLLSNSTSALRVAVLVVV